MEIGNQVGIRIDAGRGIAIQPGFFATAPVERMFKTGTRLLTDLEILPALGKKVP